MRHNGGKLFGRWGVSVTSSVQISTATDELSDAGGILFPYGTHKSLPLSHTSHINNIISLFLT